MNSFDVPDWLPKFDSLNNLSLTINMSPAPGTPFEDAVLRIASMHWWRFYNIRRWSEVFPYPDFHQATKPAGGMGKPLSPVNKGEWASYAERYFIILHLNLLKVYNTVFRYIMVRLRQNERHLKYEIGLDPDELVKDWLNSQKSDTVAGVHRLLIYEKKVNEYVDKEIERTHHRWVIPNLKVKDNNSGDRVPSIHVLPQARAALADALRPFVDSIQHDALSNLIHYGTIPESHIICFCKQVRIGLIFYSQVKEGQRIIEADKTVLARWICLHFRRSDSGAVKVLSYATILNYLSGKGLNKYQ